MTGWIVRMVGGALRCASTHRHPSAIALAIAFGLAIGSIPKDNLLVLGLVAAMCFFRMNYLLALALMVVVSVGAPWTDGVTGRLGQWLLERPNLQVFWIEIATWPVLPWFRWNNSVVLGGFLAGIASFLPVYAMCVLTTRRVVRYQTQSRVDAIVGEIKHYHVHIQTEQRKRQLLESNPPNEDRRRSIKKRGAHQHRIDKTPAIEVAKPNVSEVRPEPAMAIKMAELPSKTPSALLQETVIEIVRYRPKGQSLPSQTEVYQAITQEPSKPHPSMNLKTMKPTAPEAPNANLELSAQRQPVASKVEKTSDTTAKTQPTANEPLVEKPREEALRYLLWHLSGVHRQSRHQEPVS